MPDKKVVVVIQARMGSTRRPGKSMADLAGKPLLWQFLQRVKRAKEPDELVLATTDKPQDDVLADLARGCGVSVFRGSENDLVDRYYQAAKAHGARIVVRICADNPVVEPEEVDRIIRFHKEGGSDFSSNTHNILDNQYPDGLGAEVFDFEKLEEVWREATSPANREHPHSWFYEHPERYRIRTVACPPEFRRPELKLDVNLPEELDLLRAIYEYCYPRNPEFHITDIIRWYDTVYLPGRGAAKPPAP
ncbi:MAG: glycosyltransferase family protein [Elusimicrobiota bacterium]